MHPGQDKGQIGNATVMVSAGERTFALRNVSKRCADIGVLFCGASVQQVLQGRQAIGLGDRFVLSPAQHAREAYGDAALVTLG